ncbi:hypothetical protein PoB_005735200 [Plakobranchus ocellatus]|uniref:Uncharacterized protein n=1 Tax=Plakobranchus ocellatus TaxID=259542 RepID=A0AAV4CHE3_9GAST|nr:hypothetical protein PoB_005735200 [Plakobranchus ocellatus]
MRRSMSLETCRASETDSGSLFSGLAGGRAGAVTNSNDRQSSSLKLRCNPPETIPEEEMERIRRESLVPHVGLLAGDGRRRSSAVSLEHSSAPNTKVTSTSSVAACAGKADGISGAPGRRGGRRSSTAVTAGGLKSTMLLPKLCGNTSTNSSIANTVSTAASLFQKNSNSHGVGKSTLASSTTGDPVCSTVCSDEIISLTTQKSPSLVGGHLADDEGRAGSEASSCYSQRRDEGLGESFDRYSDLSGYNGGSGGYGETLIELHTLSSNCVSSPSQAPSPPSPTSSVAGSSNSSLHGEQCSVTSATENPVASQANRNNNVSKRKLSPCSSAPSETRRTKKEELPTENDKTFVGASQSLPLSSSQEGVEDSDHDSSGGENGIDPLFFLSDLQSKRVTFM